MITVDITNDTHKYLTKQISNIVNKYRSIEYVECIFTSIYKNLFSDNTQHIDIYLIPTTDAHYEDLKTIITNNDQEEIYKNTNFLITVIPELPRDYKDAKPLNYKKIDKINRLYNSSIIYDKNNEYVNLLTEYETYLNKCFNMIETVPKIKIKKLNKSE